MKLVFLGTRGNIDARTTRHRRHASTMFSYYGKRVMVDCGEDWLGKVDQLDPIAIVITHAHPDHAWGLKEGAPCAVYATADSWEELDPFPIDDPRVIAHREATEIAGMVFEAFPVLHSTRAPAVGYRIAAGEVTVFCVPDVAWIVDREDALHDAKAYVGDGATIKRSMIRKPKDTIIGHVPLRTQLTWCQKLGVPKMFVTHCGSQIVKDHEAAVEKVDQYARERGVEVEIATDGMERVLR